MYPYIHLFGCEVSSYYLFAMLGLVSAIFMGIFRSRSNRFYIKSNDVLYAILSAFVGAVIGAKVFQLTGAVIRNGNAPGFWTIANWESLIRGTGVFYGGLIGGIIAVLAYVRIQNLDFWELADIITPSVLTFHIFGRVGCYCAGCCYGVEDTYGCMLFEKMNSPDGVPLVPVQLFEAVFNCAVLVILLVIRPERKCKGILFPLYMISYSIGRFILEFFRGDMNRGVYLLSVSQWLSILALLAGIILLNRIRCRTR